MNGAVIAVLAKVGDSVRKGQRILIVEAMKMQHEIAAERDGVLARIHVKAGDQVATRQLLGELQSQESEVSSQKSEPESPAPTNQESVVSSQKSERESPSPAGSDY